MVMDTVRIADLKARLSEYLRAVRRGRTLTVLDRDRPVARIVPCDTERRPLTVRSPRPGAIPLARVPLPPALRVKVDVFALLAEERRHPSRDGLPSPLNYLRAMRRLYTAPYWKP